VSADTVVIDSGGANLASVLFALERLNAPATVTTDPVEVQNAKRVILPGVGAAADGHERLRAAGLTEVLRLSSSPCSASVSACRCCSGTRKKVPLMPRHHPGTIRKLKAEAGRPVPHMGWNTLVALRDDPLMEGITSAD